MKQSDEDQEQPAIGMPVMMDQNSINPSQAIGPPQPTMESNDPAVLK